MMYASQYYTNGAVCGLSIRKTGVHPLRRTATAGKHQTLAGLLLRTGPAASWTTHSGGGGGEVGGGGSLSTMVTSAVALVCNDRLID